MNLSLNAILWIVVAILFARNLHIYGGNPFGMSHAGGRAMTMLAAMALTGWFFAIMG